MDGKNNNLELKKENIEENQVSTSKEFKEDSKFKHLQKLFKLNGNENYPVLVENSKILKKKVTHKVKRFFSKKNLIKIPIVLVSIFLTLFIYNNTIMRSEYVKHYGKADWFFPFSAFEQYKKIERDTEALTTNKAKETPINKKLNSQYVNDDLNVLNDETKINIYDQNINFFQSLKTKPTLVINTYNVDLGGLTIDEYMQQEIDSLKDVNKDSVMMLTISSDGSGYKFITGSEFKTFIGDEQLNYIMGDSVKQNFSEGEYSYGVNDFVERMTNFMEINKYGTNKIVKDEELDELKGIWLSSNIIFIVLFILIIVGDVVIIRYINRKFDSNNYNKFYDFLSNNDCVPDFILKTNYGDMNEKFREELEDYSQQNIIGEINSSNKNVLLFVSDIASQSIKNEKGINQTILIDYVDQYKDKQLFNENRLNTLKDEISDFYDMRKEEYLAQIFDYLSSNIYIKKYFELYDIYDLNLLIGNIYQETIRSDSEMFINQSSTVSKKCLDDFYQKIILVITNELNMIMFKELGDTKDAKEVIRNTDVLDVLLKSDSSDDFIISLQHDVLSISEREETNLIIVKTSIINMSKNLLSENKMSQDALDYFIFYDFDKLKRFFDFKYSLIDDEFIQNVYDKVAEKYFTFNYKESVTQLTAKGVIGPTYEVPVGEMKRMKKLAKDSVSIDTCLINPEAIYQTLLNDIVSNLKDGLN